MLSLHVDVGVVHYGLLESTWTRTYGRLMPLLASPHATSATRRERDSPDLLV